MYIHLKQVLNVQLTEFYMCTYPCNHQWYRTFLALWKASLDPLLVNNFSGNTILTSYQTLILPVLESFQMKILKCIVLGDAGRWQNRKIPNFPPHMEALNIQLYTYQPPLRKIQKLAE